MPKIQIICPATVLRTILMGLILGAAMHSGASFAQVASTANEPIQRYQSDIRTNETLK